MNELPSGWTKSPVTKFAALHDNRRIPLNAKQREAMRGSYPYYGANGLVDHVNDYLFDGKYT
jgi:type I restriction enzyme S subunit